MLVRLGAADAVPPGQSLVRAGAPQRHRLLPRPAAPEREPEPVDEAYVLPSDNVTPADTHKAQRACEAYRAAELIQPRPGLFLRVRA